MNLKQLEIFVCVAETKSFSSAARRLFLTQPTVSAHIASLEKELKVCLLVRNTKGVALSEVGKELYAYAEQMLEIERKIKERFGLEGRKKGCVLRVAASTVPSQYLLPGIMTEFSRCYPGEQIKVFETDSEQVVELILSHKADIGFTGTVLEKGNCVYFPFYSDELVIVAPAEKRFLERQGKNLLSWIRKEPFILREEGSGTKKEAEKIFAAMGVSMEELMTAAIMENPETIKQSVAKGLGISVLSRLAAGREVERGEMVAFPLCESGGKRNINLVYDAAYPVLPVAQKFIDTVKKMYESKMISV